MEELVQKINFGYGDMYVILEDIDRKIELIRLLHEGLLQKREVYQDILDRIKN